MNSPSLKRSTRTRTRKNSISGEADISCALSRSSALSRPKSRPPPLQIIPEMSEKDFNIDTNSPATARPTHFLPHQSPSDTSRLTLSAYTFSIDDALLVLGEPAPRSPALSASSSISDPTSSEGVPATPGTSDDEDWPDFLLPTPRLRPQRVSIRPLCITKTQSLICKEDEDIQRCIERDEENAIVLPVTERWRGGVAGVQMAAEFQDEPEQDFYFREFEDFISLSPVTPAFPSPARRDSLILVSEALPTVIDAIRPQPRIRSRHSKPLPLLPPVTPPLSTFPSLPVSSLLESTARNSAVRRMRHVSPLPGPAPPLSLRSRPLPRISVPLDVEDCVFSEENSDDLSFGPIFREPAHCAQQDASTYYRPSFAFSVSTSSHLLQPAIPETPFSTMYGEAILPRSSTDSDAPRSSIDSTSSFAFSSSSNVPHSPFSSPSSLSCDSNEFESSQRLRSRWSSSTLGSLAAEPSRTTMFFSPIKSVLNSRTRRSPPPPQKVPPRSPPRLTPKFSKNKRESLATPSPPTNTSGKHVRRKGSRSSTSSAGTSSSERDNRDRSPSGLKRKPIPMLTFLRAN